MKRLFLIILFLSAALIAKAAYSEHTLNTHRELKPVPNSFKIARSQFLPDYQAGTFVFAGNDNISTACPADIYQFSKDTCRPPNTPQQPCGGRYRVCDCESPYVYSSEQCAARGKEGGGESCTVKGGSRNGTTYYTECVCPENYIKLTTGQNCTGKTCSYGGEKYCESPDYIECSSNYKICGQNQSGKGQQCTAKGQTKYTECSCDTTLYPQTAETCKANFGENAVLSGTICGSNERGTSCTCAAQCPSSHPDKSCGSLGAADETDDGCGGKCYKCNTCTPTCKNETNCPNGTETVANGCGGTCTICKSCTPTCRDVSEWNCLFRDRYDKIDDGCGSSCNICGKNNDGYDGTAIIFTFSPDADNVELTLPTASFFWESPSYTVDWGDGTIDRDITSDKPKHTYATAGNYDVKITGRVIVLREFPQTFVSYGYNLKQVNLVTFITEIKRLDLSTVRDLSQTFDGGKNIRGSIPPLPADLREGYRAFWECSQLSGNLPKLPEGFQSAMKMFAGCSGLTGTIPEMPESLTNGSGMFRGCSGLTGNIPRLPVGLTDVSYMFEDCSGLSGVTPVNGQYPYQYLQNFEDYRDYIDMVTGCSDAVRQHFPTSWGGTCSSCQ